jgi:hypothetical protein
LGLCSPMGPERQRQSQSRAEHKARIGGARPAENHAVHDRCNPRQRKEAHRCARNKTVSSTPASHYSEAILRIFQVASAAMVRMPGQDGGGAIELFEQHDAHQLMRPGGSPKRERQVGALA